MTLHYVTLPKKIFWYCYLNIDILSYLNDREVKTININTINHDFEFTKTSYLYVMLFLHDVAFYNLESVFDLKNY